MQGTPSSVREFLASAPVLLPLGVAALGVTVLVIGWFTQPDRYARGYAPGQPIPYSHKLHAGKLRIPCLYCHAGAERSRHAGVPPVDTCMNCHRVTRTDRPAIQALAKLYDEGRPILWARVHALPDHAYFDHRPHVGAGVLCQTCHGEIQGGDVVSQQMSMRMGNCLGCHRDARAALPPGSKIQKGPEHCNACHR